MKFYHLAIPLLAIPLLIVAAESPLVAQMEQVRGAGAEQRTLAPAQRDAALDAIAKALPDTYVFPEKVPSILARFAEQRRAGRYDVADPAVLAERATEDLRTASGDRHLYLLYNPEQYAAATTKKAATATPGPDTQGYEQRLATRDHHGLTELKILPGNIRYLKLTEFQWVPDVTGTIYDEAMRFLKDGDAVIIDLRGNPGGSHGAVRYLVSHFMDGDVLELTFLARGKAPEQSRTLDHVPAGRLTGKPLYVLIDGGVGSAAEAFAYDVQQFKLGQLVGTKTAGAANNNDFTPIAPGFMFSIPTGRPEHAVSHTNWEAVGVSPSVGTPPGQALITAQSLALARLGETPGLPRDRRAEYDWAKVAVDAQLHPVSPERAQLQSFVGRYGTNDITLVDGALSLGRPDRPPRKLIPLANALFAIEGSDKLRVRFGKNVMETTWMGDPVPRTFPRN
ncbi:S41 family peptidase [Sphingomonas sp.]|uniref:S41 family peptidase n=1 Tax=Sphingomonas sp. TaxID=28214 RepID=UPI003D6D6A15